MRASPRVQRAGKESAALGLNVGGSTRVFRLAEEAAKEPAIERNRGFRRQLPSGTIPPLPPSALR